MTYRKYKINQSYFDCIDSEDKAYWLGFIAADGCVHPPRGLVKICLSIKDENHLRLFRNSIESEHPIHIRNYKNSYCELSIVCKYLCDSLVNKGVHQAKTFTLKFPDLNEDLKNHFVRGYFDGDGCWNVCKTKRKRKNFIAEYDEIRFSLVGNEHILEAVRTLLVDNCSVKPTKLQKAANVYRLQYKGRLQVARIAEYLYKDATLFMERKRKVVKEYYEVCRPSQSYTF